MTEYTTRQFTVTCKGSPIEVNRIMADRDHFDLLIKGGLPSEDIDDYVVRYTGIEMINDIKIIHVRNNAVAVRLI